MERLHPRVRLLWVLRGIVPAVVVGVIAAVLHVFLTAGPRALTGAAVTVGVAVVAVVFVLTSIHALLRFRVFRFEVQDDALYIQRGVVTRVNTVVPYVRVQHVDTQRNPIERVVGLSHLVVYTAGSRGADVTIPGLAPDRATDLQQRLRTLAGESEPDDAV